MVTETLAPLSFLFEMKNKQGIHSKRVSFISAYENKGTGKFMNINPRCYVHEYTLNTNFNIATTRIRANGITRRIYRGFLMSSLNL